MKPLFLPFKKSLLHLNTSTALSSQLKGAHTHTHTQTHTHTHTRVRTHAHTHADTDTHKSEHTKQYTGVSFEPFPITHMHNMNHSFCFGCRKECLQCSVDPSARLFLVNKRRYGLVINECIW